MCLTEDRRFGAADQPPGRDASRKFRKLVNGDILRLQLSQPSRPMTAEILSIGVDLTAM
jgi:hypothetical protein